MSSQEDQNQPELALLNPINRGVLITVKVTDGETGNYYEAFGTLLSAERSIGKNESGEVGMVSDYDIMKNGQVEEVKDQVTIEF